jgi:hypothetical protein
VIDLRASANTYRRIWLRVGRKNEERYDEFPDGGRVKSVYVIETPDGETLEQCIVRPPEVRPPGRGRTFHCERKRWSVWRRPQQQGGGLQQ